MKTNFKMKEATNKEEAIISILDVLEENPLWLNKCISNDKSPFLSMVIAHMMSNSPEDREHYLPMYRERDIIDLFVVLKTEYYNYKDFTQYNY